MKPGWSQFKRADRVSEAIKGEIAAILSRRIKDPRIGFVTVTSVRLTADLKSATVYLAPSGEGDGGELLKNISHTTGFIKRELGKALQLRYVPDITFQLEENSPFHVLELLERLKLPGGGPE
jgi:ribosome-binding factor A